MSNQSGHGRPARMVFAQHLRQKDRQCHQRRIDAIQPISLAVRDCLGEHLLRKHIAKRQLALLQELTFQKLELSAKLSIEIPQLQGLLADDEHFDNAHLSQ
jgi:predicted ArsR family transcriptional regulator